MSSVATSEERIVIAEDKDFGQLRYAEGKGLWAFSFFDFQRAHEQPWRNRQWTW